MATFKVFSLLLLVVLIYVQTSYGNKEKRQAECFNPFYKPPYCYGGFGGGFPFGGGFGFGPAGFGAGFGPGFGAGFGPYGFGAGFGPFGPGPFEGEGVGAGAGFSTSFGGERQQNKPKGPNVKSTNPFFGGFGGGVGGSVGAGFGDFGPGFAGGFAGPYGFGGGGFGGGFGSPYGFGYNPYMPNLPPMPIVKSSGPGFSTSSGSTTYSFGPGGATTTSTSNQVVTTKAADGTWTIQSSGLPMETEPDEGTILVTASVGKPTKMDKEVVNDHEVQFNFSYKEGPKKWINLKVDDKGPAVSGVTVEQKGETVYIRGPEKRKSDTRRGFF